MTAGAAPPPGSAGSPPAGAEIIRDLFGKAEPETDLSLSRLQRNDTGNAKRLIRRFGRDLIWVKDLGWHCWSGQHWDQEGGESEAQQRAQETARLILDEARAAEADGRLKDRETGEFVETEKQFRERIDGLRGWSTTSGMTPRIRGMLEQAQPELERARRELDADPWLFNLENGSLVLNPDGTVTLRKHDRRNLATRVAPVVYDPKATCPRFIQWMEFVLPDPDDGGAEPVEGAMRGLLKRFFGYCLSGSTALQVAPLFCGTGANGKSTLVNVMRGIFGAYAQTLPVETLLENDRKGGADASPDVARMPGVRLALASEPEKKARMSTSKLKQFTGGEPIVARQLYGAFFEFHPAFKMVLSFNDRPSVPAQDDGTWRRLLLIMFDQKIPKEQRRERFELELLVEASGILNWLIQGYADWRAKGLQVPEGVRAATEAYRDDNDPIGEFLGECCLNAAGLADYEAQHREQPVERANMLYAAYELWCADTAADPISKRVFGLRLRDKGYAKGHSNGVVYQNIRLTDAWEEKARGLLERQTSRLYGRLPGAGAGDGRGRRDESTDDMAVRTGAVPDPAPGE